MPDPERQTDSALNPKPSDGPGSLIARLEQANARAYERELLAHKTLSSDPEPPVSADVPPSIPPPQQPPEPPRPARLDDARVSSGPAKRRAVPLILLLVSSVGVAAAVWQFWGDDVTKRQVVEWASRVMPGLSPQAGGANDRASAADAPRPTPPAAEPAQKAVSNNAAQDLDTQRLLQTVAREIAALRQGVDQLKASQEQLARDDATIAEQLKASSEQMTRYNAKLLDLLKMSQEQSTRDNLRIAEQFQASQEQVARALSRTSRRSRR